MSYIAILTIGILIGLFIGWANHPAKKMSFVSPASSAKTEEDLVKEDNIKEDKTIDNKSDTKKTDKGAKTYSSKA